MQQTEENISGYHKWKTEPEGLYIVYGREFKTLDEVSLAYSIPNITLLTYVPRFDTLEEALKHALTGSTIEYNGVRYVGLTDLSTSLRLDPAFVNRRLSGGMTLKEALTTPIRQKEGSFKFDYRGKSYTKKRSLYEDIGITGGLIIQRIKRYNLDFLETVTLLHDFFERHGKSNEVMISSVPYAFLNGEMYKTEVKLLKYLGIRESNFHSYRASLSASGIHGLKNILLHMQTREEVIIRDSHTGEIITARAAKKRYKKDYKILYQQGYVLRELVLKHPTLEGVDLSTLVDVNYELDKEAHEFKNRQEVN